MTPESLANFITNNYATDNCYVPDQDGASNSAGSVDGFAFEDIDEIDTKNMAIYSGGAKKTDDSVTRQSGSKSDSTSKKQEPIKSELARKSLLLPSNSAVGSAQGAVDTDLMLNVLDQGSSGSSEKETVAAPNSLFDETSQVKYTFYEQL